MKRNEIEKLSETEDAVLENSPEKKRREFLKQTAVLTTGVAAGLIVNSNTFAQQKSIPKGHSSDVQLLKTPTGDAMMVVAIDKRTLGRIVDKELVVGILDREIDFKIPLCTVRYDKLRIRRDLIINPGFVRTK